jgi:superfamily II DNA helicase RecQ
MAEMFDSKIARVLADLRIEFPLKTLQKVCLEKLANRLDVFAVLPTGYGKSVIRYFTEIDAWS